MPPMSRNKYTDEDDRLMWKYFVGRLKKKDPECQHPSLNFWSDFREKYNWDRAVSGIESHFRKQLKSNIHKSGLRDRYLFTAMKAFKTQLNLMDYDELERKHNCVIFKTDNMIFKRAVRGNTEISKLPTQIDYDDDDEAMLSPRREHVFEISSDSESDLQQTTLPQIVPRSSVNPTAISQPNVNPNQPPNPFTQMRLNWQRNSLGANLPTTSSTTTVSPIRHITLRKKPATNTTPAKSSNIKQSPQDTPIASRTRSSAHPTPSHQAQSPAAKKSKKHLDKTPQNEPQPSTSRSTQPTLAQIKAVLIERMQQVLSGELEPKKLDDHPLLTQENVKGFEKMLEQQKLMLAVLMANNNQLNFFDKDYRPVIEKQRLIPGPKLIKIERTDSQTTNDAESVDNEQLMYAYDSSIE